MKRLTYVLLVLVIGVYSVQSASSMPMQSSGGGLSYSDGFTSGRTIDNVVAYLPHTPLTRPEVNAENHSEFYEMDLNVVPCDAPLFGSPNQQCQDNFPNEIKKEAETAGEKYLKGEERAENMERRGETERSWEKEQKQQGGVDSEEIAEHSESVRETDVADSEEANEFIHETIRENHPDLGDTLLTWLGVIGSIASIVGLIVVIK